MHPPIFVREPSAEERARLEAALRAADAFTVRRAQIVLLSAEGRRPREIARGFRCAFQTARNAIRAFNARGLAALTAGSPRPKSVAPPLDQAKLEHLDAGPPGAGRARAGAERHPPVGRDDPTGAAAAGGGLEAGQALADQPRPGLRSQKGRRDRLIRLAGSRPGWVLGFADEVWFSR